MKAPLIVAARLALSLALSSVAVHLARAAWAVAIEPPPVRSPVSPQESVAHLALAPGLKIELVAHEPQVVDPVAIRFDEDGRMWVVEMRDYPTGTPGGKGGSRISLLEDRDGDGFFETATVFAENLPFATGLQPWKGGVFVTMAGQVAYMKDTTDDGKADINETWYTGFAEENTQLRANHPTLGLDNHIYIANGLRGGTIVDAQRADAKPVSISGMDFRFDPRTRNFEAVSGAGQFGLAFDDYGNRFVTTNRNPAIHIVLEDRYLKKNPLVAVAAVSHDVARAGDQSRVFPVGPAWTTSNLHAGQFTAACGLEIYRGNALPAEFYGNIFVCEPTGHLVHREIMKPRGVTFTSQPAYEAAEFVASRDEWFSPVNLETGPDGALYIVDMYRAVIEHPEWMPEELRQRPDLLAGNDRGRIYRVIAKDWQRNAGGVSDASSRDVGGVSDADSARLSKASSASERPPTSDQRSTKPQLSASSSATLVEILSHPNAWWRETAARLLLERQDKTVSAQLHESALRHNSHVARIHALRLLEGLDLLTSELLLQLLGDADARVVEQAIRAAESRLAKPSPLRKKIAELVRHEDARVRFQALLTATPTPPPPVFHADRWEIDAMLIAAGQRGGEVLSQMLQSTKLVESHFSQPKRFVADLAHLAAASQDKRQQAIALNALLDNAAYRSVGLAALLLQVHRHDGSIDNIRSALDDRARHKLDAAFEEARVAARNPDQPDSVRGEAIELLALSDDASAVLAPLALEEPNQSIRLRAIAALAKTQDTAPWRQLLRRFANETPALQGEILDGVFRDPARTRLLLEQIAAGRIAATALDATRVNRLLDHRDDEIKRRAQKLLAEALPTDRRQALADYQAVLTMKAEPARGRAVFQKQCANCHRIDGLGVDVAPDISDSREKSGEQLLADIIQPNRAIDSNYFGYTAVTVDGLVHTGILTAETSTSVTLKQAEGKTMTLRRAEIEELYSNGVSLMPDGMEKLIPPQDMADLIAFIKNWRYLDGRGESVLQLDAQRTERGPGQK